MSDRDPMVHIRMPEELRHELQTRAKASARSMNAEIVQRLEQSLPISQFRGESRLRHLGDTLVSDELEWVNLWLKMEREQRKLVLAMVRAVVNLNKE